MRRLRDFSTYANGNLVVCWSGHTVLVAHGRHGSYGWMRGLWRTSGNRCVVAEDDGRLLEDGQNWSVVRANRVRKSGMPQALRIEFGQFAICGFDSRFHQQSEP